MAKVIRTGATSEESSSIDSLIHKATQKKDTVSVSKYFAVRQKSGPKPHDDLIIKGTSGVDAHRQWFNYYGLNEQTYRYKLTVVQVPDGHVLEKQAIECQSPRNPETLSWEDQAKQASDDLETMFSPGD